jgi:nucleoside phosphorylase
MRTFPNIRIGLMVGVAGGAPSAEHDVRLGDVVVSCRGGGEGAGGDVIAYDVGKALHDEDGDRFAITGHLNKPPLLTQAALTRLKHRSVRKGYQIDDKVARALEGEKKAVRQKYSSPPAETDKLFRSDFLHPSPEEQCKGTCDKEVGNVVARPVRDEDEDEVLVVHYGPIASGNTLVKNSTLREELRRKGVLCFETEAAGLKDHFPCLVIRGICDYADSHKNKEWQGFASMAAAAYAKDILLEIPPEEVQSAQKLSADLKAGMWASNLQDLR